MPAHGLNVFDTTYSGCLAIARYRAGNEPQSPVTLPQSEGSFAPKFYRGATSFWSMHEGGG